MATAEFVLEAGNLALDLVNTQCDGGRRDADPDRIRQGDDETCVLWFLDTSKNGRRRWCSMARCGNRAKVAAHYYRGTRRKGK
jgi:predicted RNA-binding Zn ribbon-like protein